MLIAVLVVIAAALVAIAYLQWRGRADTARLHATVVPWLDGISARIGDDRTTATGAFGASGVDTTLSVLGALEKILVNQIPVNLTGLHQLATAAQAVLAEFTSLTPDTRKEPPQ